MHVSCVIAFFQAADANDQLDYTLGRKLSNKSLWFNIAAVVTFIILMVIAVLIGIVFVFISKKII